MKMISDTILVKIDLRKESFLELPQVREIDGHLIQQEEIRTGTVLASGAGARRINKKGKHGPFQPNATKPGDRVLVNMRKGLSIPMGEDHVRTFHEGNILAIIEE